MIRDFLAAVLFLRRELYGSSLSGSQSVFFSKA